MQPIVNGAASSPPKVSVQGLAVVYGSNPVITDMSLEIGDGEFVCLLGPSGCGKTTLLNAIGGFVPAAAGRITVDGAPVAGPGADRGMVFQEYALFPWFTVEQNVQYGPRLRGVPAHKLRELSDHYLALVQLDKFKRQFPNQLSGGQRQRVAIARALANDPKILLMDEPFGALDAMTREALQEELLRIWEAERRTCVFVTHAIGEAVFLADTVVIMQANPGRIARVLENTVARPRNRTSDAYFALYRRVDEALREAHEAHAGSPGATDSRAQAPA